MTLWVCTFCYYHFYSASLQFYK